MDHKLKKSSVTYKKFLNALNNEDTEDNELYSILKEHNKFKRNLVAERFLNKDIESIYQVNSDLKEKLIIEKSLENVEHFKKKAQEKIIEFEQRAKRKIKNQNNNKKEKLVTSFQKETPSKISFVDKIVEDALLVGGGKKSLSLSISENDIDKFKPILLSEINETPIEKNTISINNDSFNSKARNKSLSISLSSIKQTYNNTINKEFSTNTVNFTSLNMGHVSPKKKQLKKFFIPLNKPLIKANKSNKGLKNKEENLNNIASSFNTDKLNNSFLNISNSKEFKKDEFSNFFLQSQEIQLDAFHSVGEEGNSKGLEKERPVSIKKEKQKTTKEDSEIIDSMENLLFEEVLELKNRFFNGEKFSKGKVVEMVYGKKIPKVNIKYDNDDDHFKLIKDLKLIDKSINHKNYFEDKLREILENNPQIILKLFEKKDISDEEIKELFVLNQIKIKWDNDLEHLYRDIVNKKTYSNRIKNTYFMFEIKFSKTNKENFIKKHYVDKNTMNQKEIQEFSIIYNKIRVLYKNVFLGSNLITNVFIRRDEMIDSLLNNSRKEYLGKKIVKFRTISEEKKNFSEQLNQKFEKEEFDLRKYVLLNSMNYNSLYKSRDISSISRKHHNKILQNLSPHKNKYIDKENIIYKEQLKNKTIYIKSTIELYKQKLGPKNFKYNILSKNNKETKKIVHYFAEKLQGSIRGLMLRIYIFKMNKNMKIIQKTLRKYLSLKNFIIQIIKNFDSTNNYKPFRLLVRILYWNYSMSYKYNFKGGNELLIVDFFNKYLGKKLKSLPMRVSANTMINAIQHVISELSYSQKK